VEVQIAADHHGRVVHLLERDCSIQRNNQKVLEEAPAPDLPEAIRAGLLEDAVRLVRAIGYRNLGTIEFLVDARTGERFFLEMNTRLQVEHPVTEMITGLDLVEWQLRIASDEPLPLDQAAIAVRGHAIEARLAAERPEAGFMPATGGIALWHPPSGEGVRIDAGIETGSEVTVHYDSMIAKVIAHGATREEARRRLLRALDDLVVLGPQTNRAFLVDIVRMGPFAQARATTTSLADLYPNGWTRPTLAPEIVAGLAAAAHLSATRDPREGTPSPWSMLRGFRLPAAAGRPAVQEVAVALPDGMAVAHLCVEGESVSILVEDLMLEVRIEPVAGALTIRLEGDARRGIAQVTGENVWLRFGDIETTATIRPFAGKGDAANTGRPGDIIAAPMPGIVAEVRARLGDTVEAGAPLVVIESMKLFQTLLAPRAGRIARIDAVPGQSVAAGHVLLGLEPDPEL
jgi:acetyl/propionyl-CoA carboxylase alpha subunit